jgi:hypothetical protein
MKKKYSQGKNHQQHVNLTVANRWKKLQLRKETQQHVLLVPSDLTAAKKKTATVNCKRGFFLDITSSQ